MKNENVTRKHLAGAIHEQIGFSKQISGELVDAFFDRLKDSLLAENDVMLAQFGRFKVRQKSSRMGRNPRSGESIEICKRSMVSFKPSKLLRDKINREL
jgi:integration host factor subunit alpha